jgi:RNA polymerase sigma factor (sigma-70 family)
MQRADSTGDGEALFLSQLDLIERVTAFVCARHHVAPGESDDFASHVKLKMIEDEYAVLKKFEGRSSLRTYLTIVIQRLFFDFRITAWGKWRPSAEARRAGSVGTLLEQLTVRDGYTFEEACELLRTNHRVAASRHDLECIAARLPDRAKRRFESDDALASVPAPTRAVEDVVADRDRRSIAHRTSEVLRSLMDRVDAQDALILALRFEDGQTVAEIAITLRQDQKGLYRRIDRLLRELRAGLEAAGVDRASVLEMLESPAVSIEWKGAAKTEMLDARPSLAKGARK